MACSGFDNEQKIWHGAGYQPLFHRNVSLGQVILWMLQRNPNKIGQVCNPWLPCKFKKIKSNASCESTILEQISDNNGLQITNRELHVKTIRMAQNLTRLGLCRGDIISAAVRNHHHLAPMVFAAMTLGCPFNALDPTHKQFELAHMLCITRPKLVVCDHTNVTVVQDSCVKAGIAPLIFTIDEATAQSRSIDELLEPTNVEHEFMYVISLSSCYYLF